MTTKAANAVSLQPHDTVRTAVSALAGVFRAAGIEGPETDARYLAGGILGLDGADLIANPDRPLGDAAAALQDAMARRLAAEPVSRILNVRAFYGRDIVISPGVLDPRPDTETLIDVVLDLAAENGWHGRPLRIADIGTGSGAILLTLLAELPEASGVAIDISLPALDVAKANAERFGVAARVTFVHTQGLEDVVGPFDLIVSNPPYIPAADIAGLDASVRDFDPILALDGGPDGLTVYREIASQISRFSGPMWVVLEVGAGQAENVAALFSARLGGAIKSGIRYRKDLGGHTRCVALQIQR